MREGLTILQVAGNYYGRSVTIVGWLRQVAGDEFEMLPGYRTVWRKSGHYNQGGLDLLASEGLDKDYEASKPAKTAEQIHRLLVRRPKPCVEESWRELIPRPSGFEAKSK